MPYLTMLVWIVIAVIGFFVIRGIYRWITNLTMFDSMRPSPSRTVTYSQSALNPNTFPYEIGNVMPGGYLVKHFGAYNPPNILAPRKFQGEGSCEDCLGYGSILYMATGPTPTTVILAASDCSPCLGTGILYERARQQRNEQRLAHEQKLRDLGMTQEQYDWKLRQDDLQWKKAQPRVCSQCKGTGQIYLYTGRESHQAYYKPCRCQRH